VLCFVLLVTGVSSPWALWPRVERDGKSMLLVMSIMIVIIALLGIGLVEGLLSVRLQTYVYNVWKESFDEHWQGNMPLTRALKIRL